MDRYDNYVVGEYFDWLVDKFCTDGKHHPEKYSGLLDFLSERLYYWELDFDSNRAGDGEELRWIFENDTSEKLEDWDANEPCSVLEMLCALAKRVEDYIACPVRGKENPSRWFWEMLENCGLAELDDEHWDESRASSILDFVLDRKYDRNGTGGFWPLENPAKDQRKVDLWYQANSYFGQMRKNRHKRIFEQ